MRPTGRSCGAGLSPKRLFRPSGGRHHAVSLLAPRLLFTVGERAIDALSDSEESSAAFGVEGGAIDVEPSLEPGRAIEKHGREVPMSQTQSNDRNSGSATSGSPSRSVSSPRQVPSRLLRRDDLAELAAHRGTCISIYLPTHRKGPEIEQDPIRLKNLLTRAERELAARELEEDRIRALMKPARRLLDDDDFWRHQSDGLAVLLNGDTERVFRLPISFSERAHVADHFYLKPLLPLLTQGSRFYVLALSRGEVRLLAASLCHCAEIELDEAVPRSLADALGYDWEQRSLQFHGQRRGGSRREKIFHGHGAGTDDRESELRRFLEVLDRGLRQTLSETGIPMVLAGVDEVTSLFRQLSSYPQLLEESVVGNPDDLSNEQLHERALEVVRPVFDSERQAAAGRFAERLGTGKASDRLAEVLDAAHEGRIEALFVPRGREVWGRYDPRRRELMRLEAPQDDAEELLDHAAMQCLATGATVYAVEPDAMPGGGEIAAVYRY